jgi:protein-disulfide isomerase
MSRHSARSWLSCALLWWACSLLSSACAAPPARSSSDEIDLAAPADEPPEPALRQQTCKKDDTGCQRAAAAEDAADSAPPLDPEQRYEIEVVTKDPRKGPARARVTAIVFSDYQCPYCKQLELTLAELELRYAADLRVIWKDLPLPSHDYAGPAALLAREAHAKGGDALFWQVHAELFDRQVNFSDGTLQQVAKQFALHWPPSAQYQPLIDASYAEGVRLNVRATPTTFVNGRPIIGAKPLEVYAQRIDEELAHSKASSAGAK